MNVLYHSGDGMSATIVISDHPLRRVITAPIIPTPPRQRHSRPQLQALSDMHTATGTDGIFLEDGFGLSSCIPTPSYVRAIPGLRSLPYRTDKRILSASGVPRISCPYQARPIPPRHSVPMHTLLRRRSMCRCALQRDTNTGGSSLEFPAFLTVDFADSTAIQRSDIQSTATTSNTNLHSALGLTQCLYILLGGRPRHIYILQNFCHPGCTSPFPLGSCMYAQVTAMSRPAQHTCCPDKKRRCLR
ncbi:hypothetical protein C8R43DRAFT_1245060 [Mycena crocata]|nr:hypothetical protein C8R43DRAFT_1245060 [Mycena crocata]